MWSKRVILSCTETLGPSAPVAALVGRKALPDLPLWSKSQVTQFKCARPTAWPFAAFIWTTWSLSLRTKALPHRLPLVLEPDPYPVGASSTPAPTVALPKRTLKYYQQLLVGAHIAYSSAEHPDRTFRVGKVTHLMQAELSCAVHRMGALQDGRLRVRFQLLYIDAEGMETTTGVKPSIEQVPSTRLIREVHLLPKGDMWHSEARALNQQNWRLASTSLSAPCDLRAAGCAYLVSPSRTLGGAVQRIPRLCLQLRNPHASASPPRTHCSIACPPAMLTFWKSSPAVAN